MELSGFSRGSAFDLGILVVANLLANPLDEARPDVLGPAFHAVRIAHAQGQSTHIARRNRAPRAGGFFPLARTTPSIRGTGAAKSGSSGRPPRSTTTGIFRTCARPFASNAAPPSSTEPRCGRRSPSASPVSPRPKLLNNAGSNSTAATGVSRTSSTGSVTSHSTKIARRSARAPALT